MLKTKIRRLNKKQSTLFLS